LTPLSWIIVSGLVMAALSLEGGVFSLGWFDGGGIMKRVMRPLVALAAGTMIGGSLLHMMPEGLERFGEGLGFFLWVAVGFAVFFALEQLIHWHHCNRAAAVCKNPVGYLVIAGDCFHHLLAGLAVGGAFIADIRLGVTIWLLAVAHEIPKELGDFAVLVHSGFHRGRALLLNFFSSLPFLAGGLLAWSGSGRIDISFLVPLAAGQFLYVGASDLIPEISGHDRPLSNLVNFLFFLAGMAFMAVLALAHHH